MLSQAKLNINDKIGNTVTMTQIINQNAALRELARGGIDKTLRCKTIPDATASIEFKNVLALNGNVVSRFSNLADGSIITLFDKTPFPKAPDDVVCPHFVELKWANGCNFDCAWCYLNGTMRFRPNGKAPYMKNKSKVVEHIKSYLCQNNMPSLLNSGELSDSLLFEGNGSALSDLIVPLFKDRKTTNIHGHKLLILTKSTNIKRILAAKAQDSVVASFSINSYEVAKRWEKKAPSPKQRIQAAKKLYDAGYAVRVRIDPIVPIDSWKSEYKELIDYLFDNFTPERITIGSLRGLQSTINFCKDRSWVEYLDETSNWGKKVSVDTRFEMYRTIIGYLKTKHKFARVGLCKETMEMWGKLKMNYKQMPCNCTL